MTALLTGILTTVAQSPWVFGVLIALLLIDSVLPIVPAETTVVILATLGAAGTGPSVWSVLLVSIAATMAGDGLAFLIGRKLGLTRWSWMRRPSVARASHWASERISRRPIVSLTSAKFVPVLRVAVTMAAGASPIPVWRYLVGSLMAAVVYTSYHVAIASLAGSALSASPLLAVGASLAVTLAVGALVELVRRARRRTAALDRVSHENGATPR